jgi:hypothetical protein
MPAYLNTKPGHSALPNLQRWRDRCEFGRMLRDSGCIIPRLLGNANSHTSMILDRFFEKFAAEAGGLGALEDAAD